MSEFGARIKGLRTICGKTQKDVADAVGCSYQSVSFYEKGEREPAGDVILRFAAYFGVTTDYLIGHDLQDTAMRTSVRWYPVRQCKPRERARILCADQYGYVHEAIYHNGAYYTWLPGNIVSAVKVENVNYVANLPDAPRGEREAAHE